MLQNLNQKINMKPIDQVKHQYIAKQTRVQQQYHKYQHEGEALNARQIRAMQQENNVTECPASKENLKNNYNQPFRKNVETRVPLSRELKQDKLHGLQNKIQSLDDQLSRIPSQSAVQVKKLEHNFIDKNLEQLLAQDTHQGAYQHYEQTPVDKQQQDMNKFKRVFINPQENKLAYINQQKQRIIDEMNHGARVQYDKLLQIHVEDKQNNNTEPLCLLAEDDHDTNEQGIVHEQNKQMTHFFHEQIENAPPSLPNATIASPLTPGNGWAPSIPYLGDPKDNQSIRDLQIKLRAGMQAGDIQKEGHLSFLLGELCQKRGLYGQSIKYYSNYSRCANLQKDKVGLALAFNRMGYNHFKLDQLSQSEQCHRQSQKLSEQHYLFAAGYNLGILLRRQGRVEAALECFQECFGQAQSMHHLWSLCLSLGQLGITHLNLQPTANEQAHHYLTKCLALAQQLNNQPIIMDCLFQLSRLEHPSFPHLQHIQQCLKDNRICQISLANLGICQGKAQLSHSLPSFPDTF